MQAVFPDYRFNTCWSVMQRTTNSTENLHSWNEVDKKSHISWDFTEIHVYNGRQLISRKMSWPWNH